MKLKYVSSRQQGFGPVASPRFVRGNRVGREFRCISLEEQQEFLKEFHDSCSPQNEPGVAIQQVGGSDTPVKGTVRILRYVALLD